MSQGTPKRHTINHFMHNHPLTEANVVGTYTCNGCKLYGNGKTYRCSDCDYDLHEYCATCLPTIRNTWHAPDHELNLISGPAHMTERGCYVCRVYIQGMFYKCKNCSFESHPLCTHVPLHFQPPDATLAKQRSFHDQAGYIHGPMHPSSPDATVTRQRSLHDPHAGQPSSPHHYGQGFPYGYAPVGLNGPHPHGGGHHQQQPHMNPGSPKADLSPDSSKGKKKNRGILRAVQGAIALSGTLVTQLAVATVAEEYPVYEG